MTRPPTTRDFSFTVDGPIATIALDRSVEQNRLTPEALADLGAVAASLRHDSNVHVLVIRGRGSEFFSAGILNPENALTDALASRAPIARHHQQ